MHEITKIVVVGGGTAGWLSALYVRKYFPDLHITVIESSEIGILGAGEGTTPHFVAFLQNLGIKPKDIIKNAKGTFKNSIKFTNWNGDGKSYYHKFLDNLDLLQHDDVSYHNIAGNGMLENYCYSALVSNQNKIKFTANSESITNNTLADYDSQGTFGLHFDASLLASYLKNIGIDRDIHVIDGIVKNVRTDEAGFITSLELEDQNVLCDFVFDCSGFRRLLIGQHFKTKWVDYSETIPNKKAIPFFLDNNTQTIPPYTESIAMKYGWVWKIPVQGRYGCGYVFDSDLVTDQEIINELEEYFQQKINSPRSFKFNPGCYEDVWVKNCLAVGLSSGFIEPLEATSIWVTITTLVNFTKNIQGMLFRNQNYIDNLNGVVKRMNNDILTLLYFHYNTKRTDTVYWKDFREKNIPPEDFIKFENKFNKYFNLFTNDPLQNYFYTTFEASSFSQIGLGLDFYDSDTLRKQAYCLSAMCDPNITTNKLDSFRRMLQERVRDSVDHYEMLERLKG